MVPQASDLYKMYCGTFLRRDALVRTSPSITVIDFAGSPLDNAMLRRGTGINTRVQMSILRERGCSVFRVSCKDGNCIPKLRRMPI